MATGARVAPLGDGDRDDDDCHDHHAKAGHNDGCGRERKDHC